VQRMPDGRGLRRPPLLRGREPQAGAGMSDSSGNPFSEIDGLRPVVDPSAFVHPDASVVGDVFIGAGAFIGPFASLRGDFGRIVIGPGANVQDCCACHAFPGETLEVEEDGHIGHCSMLHGCRIGRNAMVGIGAVVLDGATVGESAIVGAKALVTAGFAVPPRTLAVGMPAKVARELRDDEIGWKGSGTRAYQRLALRYRESYRPCEPLREPEPDRLRVEDIHPEELDAAPKKSGEARKQ